MPWGPYGVTLWPEGTFRSSSMRVISDGESGAIISGNRYVGTEPQLCSQKLNSNGTIHSGWPTDGVLIALTSSSSNEITSDGDGGVIIVWDDTDARAQRVDRNGVVQWQSGGIAICSVASSQDDCKIVPDGSGGAVVSWRDSRSSQSIYAQKINAAGNLLWHPDGVPVGGITTWKQNEHELTSDGAGGAIVSWRDYRTGDKDIYAARIDSDGASVATFLQQYSYTVGESTVTLRWTLSRIPRPIVFEIFRTIGNYDVFQRIGSLHSTRNNQLYTFIDDACECGINYRYRVDIIENNQRSVLFVTELVSTPELHLTLYHNYPNPFNPSTNIRYYMPQKSHVALEIYDVSGKRIACLVDKEQEKGYHIETWNGQDMNGRAASSGIYFYRLTVCKESISKKMVLLR